MTGGPSRLTLLTRHFFRRFLDNDLISPNGDAHVGLSQAVAALLMPGMFVATIVMFKYGMLWRPRWNRVLEMSVSDSLLYVSLSMIVLGVAATVSWDAFFLDARDRYILSVLPVSRRLLSAAKLGALGMFLAVFVAAVNVIPAIVVPGLMVQGLRDESGFAHFLPLTFAQAVAPALAGAWTVLAVVAMRGVLALALPGRLFHRASPLLQGFLILGFLGWAISLSPFLDAGAALVSAGGPARDYSPPMWFLGLYQSILGNPNPACLPLARTALGATGLTTLLVLAVFFIPGHGRSEQAAAAGAGTLRPLLGLLRSLAGRVAIRHALGRASFTFMLTTIGRSAKHRMYLAGALGAGLAWAATGLVWDVARSGRSAFGTLVPSAPALQAQLVLVLFLVAATRFSVLVPASLPANWLFRLAERRPPARYFAGARRAALLVALSPVAALAPVSVVLWGWGAGAYHAMVGFLYAAFLVELFFNGLAKFPFTATYVSGQLKLKSRIGYYLFGVMALTGVPAWLESLTFRGLVDRTTLPILLLALTCAFAVARWRKEKVLPGLVFDDSGAEEIQTLRLSE